MPTEIEILQASLMELNSTSRIVSAEDITQVDRLKVAVCGPPKTGKSFLIAKTARKPLLMYDFDDRRESIAGFPGTHIKTLVDLDDNKPQAWGVFESDIGTLVYQKEQKKFPWASIALDSATFLRKCAEHQFLKDATGASRATLKVGVTTYLIPKDWDAVTGVQHMLENALAKIFSLGCDVYMTFHTRPERDQQKSTGTNVVYKDKLTVEPPNLKMLLPKFNDVWRTVIDTNGSTVVYKIQMKPDWEFDAATVLKNMEQTEEADIQKLLEKHNKQR